MSDQQNFFTTAEFKKNFVKNPKAKKEKNEEKVQLKVCSYLRAQYPDLIWMCDLASGLWLPPQVSVMHKKMRSSRGLPDLFISYPGKIKTGFLDMMGNDIVKTYHGLFIELKKEGARKKDGSLPAAKRQIKKKGVVVQEYDHHKEQAEILAKLSDLGYKAVFCAGFDEAKEVIDKYIRG